jgi:pyruvate/2-oxoglutarate dehydrogenase complex dihydrolipoamide dehydrogenase (E3) component
VFLLRFRYDVSIKTRWTFHSKENSMKLLIVGAGIIGSIYGWALAEAGHDVTHLVRPGKAAKF